MVFSKKIRFFECHITKFQQIKRHMWEAKDSMDLGCKSWQECTKGSLSSSQHYKIAKNHSQCILETLGELEIIHRGGQSKIFNMGVFG